MIAIHYLIILWSEVVTNCHRLKSLAPDGKLRETDDAKTKSLLRIITLHVLPFMPIEGSSILPMENRLF